MWDRRRARWSHSPWMPPCSLLDRVKSREDNADEPACNPRRDGSPLLSLLQPRMDAMLHAGRSGVPRNRGPLSRRGLLASGAVGILGLSFPELLRRQVHAASANSPRAKNVLVILEQGGLSHIDTWDPKPNVSSDHRSPFAPVQTSVPGIHYTALLTRTARWAHKLAVVRSMYHPRGGADGHPEGTKYVLSGSHPPARPRCPTSAPS